MTADLIRAITKARNGGVEDVQRLVDMILGLDLPDDQRADLSDAVVELLASK